MLYTALKGGYLSGISSFSSCPVAAFNILIPVPSVPIKCHSLYFSSRHRQNWKSILYSHSDNLSILSLQDSTVLFRFLLCLSEYYHLHLHRNISQGDWCERFQIKSRNDKVELILVRPFLSTICSDYRNKE